MGMKRASVESADVERASVGAGSAIVQKEL